MAPVARIRTSNRKCAAAQHAGNTAEPEPSIGGSRSVDSTSSSLSLPTCHTGLRIAMTTPLMKSCYSRCIAAADAPALANAADIRQTEPAAHHLPYS